jgi:hypothetical protein
VNRDRRTTAAGADRSGWRACVFVVSHPRRHRREADAAARAPPTVGRAGGRAAATGGNHFLAIGGARRGRLAPRRIPGRQERPPMYKRVHLSEVTRPDADPCPATLQDGVFTSQIVAALMGHWCVPTAARGHLYRRSDDGGRNRLRRSGLATGGWGRPPTDRAAVDDRGRLRGVDANVLAGAGRGFGVFYSRSLDGGRAGPPRQLAGEGYAELPADARSGRFIWPERVRADRRSEAHVVERRGETWSAPGGFCHRATWRHHRAAAVGGRQRRYPARVTSVSGRTTSSGSSRPS